MPNTHNIPKLARAVWNRDEKACDAVWSSALTFICALADAVLIMHSTRKLDEEKFEVRCLATGCNAMNGMALHVPEEDLRGGGEGAGAGAGADTVGRPRPSRSSIGELDGGAGSGMEGFETANSDGA
ncbi:hypothetical protein SDJN02_01216, partial [Cucurbita argyrosperma subsp. argyrosperma]